MANESASGQASVKVPETECVVPRGGERELTIRRDHDVRHEVVMPMENTFWISVGVIVTSQLPYDDSLV